MMGSVDVHISVTNLPQIDRHQNDIHKNPIVSQDLNAKIADNEIAKKVTMPNDPESTQGKTIDPNQKKEEFNKKKKNKKNKNDISPINKRSGDEGLIVDIEA